MINFILFEFFVLIVSCKAIDSLTKHNIPQNMLPLPTETYDVFYGNVPIERHQNKIYPNQQNHRFRRSSAGDLQLPKSWNFVRQYICGVNNHNCLKDER